VLGGVPERVLAVEAGTLLVGAHHVGEVSVLLDLRHLVQRLEGRQNVLKLVGEPLGVVVVQRDPREACHVVDLLGIDGRVAHVTKPAWPSGKGFGTGSGGDRAAATARPVENGRKF